MSDDARKVLEETWEAEHDYIFQDGRSILGIVPVPDHAVRARIAACAPEALRLLESVEWVTEPDDLIQRGFRECPHCGVREPGPHKDSCPLDALMRKAGLRK